MIYRKGDFILEVASQHIGGFTRGQKWVKVDSEYKSVPIDTLLRNYRNWFYLDQLTPVLPECEKEFPCGI